MAIGPQDISGVDWAINMGAALVGGIVRFMKEWKANFDEWPKGRIFFEGVLNATYAGFAAMLTFLLMKSWNADQYYTIFACGVMGHMGPEGINMLTEVITNAMRSRDIRPPKE